MADIDIESLGDGKRHRKILQDLKKASVDPDVVDDSIDSSYMFKDIDAPKEKPMERHITEEPDPWSDAISALSEPTFLKKARKIDPEKFFPLETKKEKKKRKKEKRKNQDGPTDFEKVFSSEEIALTNLLKEQSAFTRSLQEEWNTTISRKGTSRGVTKTSTEVASNISSARTLLLSIIKSKTDLKKLQYDLALKEKKELGMGEAEGEGTGYMGSDLIRQAIAERAHMATDGVSDREVVSFDDLVDTDGLFSDLDDRAGSSEAANAEAYLRLELMEPEVYVVLGESRGPEDYEFLVLTKDGDDITDEYPLPEHGKLSINESLGRATDKYGQIFKIYNPIE